MARRTRRGHGSRRGGVVLRGKIRRPVRSYLPLPHYPAPGGPTSRAAGAAVPHEARVHGVDLGDIAWPGRRSHMSTLPPARDVLLWGGTLRRCPMLPTKTYIYTRDEIVELVRFKSLEQGHDPDDVFRNYAAGDWRHFSRLLEAYAFCAMLPKDDPIFTS